MRRELLELRIVAEQSLGACQRMDAFWVRTRPNWNDGAYELFGIRHVAPLEEGAKQFQVTLRALIEAFEAAEGNIELRD